MDYSRLHVEELRVLLAERQLDSSGKKNDLISRLITYDEMMAPECVYAADCAGQRQITSFQDQQNFANGLNVSLPQSHKTASCEDFVVADVHAVGSPPEPSESEGIISSGAFGDISTLNEDERMEFRKQKFGVYDKNAEEIKRLQRAKRFGLVTQELEEEKKKVRATRFGTRTTSPKNVQKGNTIAPLVVTTDENEKRIRRAERFGIVPSHQEDIKRKQRSKRFQTQQNASQSKSVAELEKATGAESWNAKVAARQLRFGVVKPRL